MFELTQAGFEDPQMEEIGKEIEGGPRACDLCEDGVVEGGQTQIREADLQASNTGRIFEEPFPSIRGDPPFEFLCESKPL